MAELTAEERAAMRREWPPDSDVWRVLDALDAAEQRLSQEQAFRMNAEGVEQHARKRVAEAEQRANAAEAEVASWLSHAHALEEEKTITLLLHEEARQRAEALATAALAALQTAQITFHSAVHDLTEPHGLYGAELVADAEACTAANCSGWREVFANPDAAALLARHRADVAIREAAEKAADFLPMGQPEHRQLRDALAARRALDAPAEAATGK